MKGGRNAYGSSCCKETQCIQSILSRLLWHPSTLQPLPQSLEGSASGNYTSHQGVVTTDLKEKGHRDEFKAYDLVDVNGGLWYGVPIFTFLRDKWIKVLCQSPTWNTIMSVFTKCMRTPSRSCSPPNRSDQHQKRNNNNHISLIN